MDRFEKHGLISRSAFSPLQSKEKASTDLNEDVLPEPICPELYGLSYTCLLIPWLPSHQLEGGLAECLPQWLQQICASYHWQIEFFTVNPDYFQWGLRVIRSTKTDQFMQEIRHGTSELILSTFEHIRNENLTNDFWAAGHLVVLGTRPNPEEMIRQYIRMTRRQQGSSLPDLRVLHVQTQHDIQ
jgi:REP element-mobilizing transposase RayT